MLTIRTLGKLEVVREGEVVELPQSRKTRALLAYLSIEAREHRRQRLCELLWNVPDDPKGALRWSLSKLRGALDTPERRHIVALRDTVRLDTDGVDVDLVTLRERLRSGPDRLSIEALDELAASVQGEFLEGLDLPDLPDFQSWCVAEREDARVLRAEVLRTLARRLSDDPPRALPYARTLVSVDPFDLSARAHLIRLLNAANRRDEAEAQRDVAVRMAREIGPEAVREFNDAARLGEDVGASEAGRPAGAAPARAIHQEVRYCVTSDSIRLAYASVGEGPPLVKTANWLSHLEFDWESPVWRHMLRELCREHRLVRYDERGLGLSDWSTDVLSLDRFVEDLETVVEASVEGRFALLGVSQGATAAVAYAVRHPDRLTHLILYGGYASGWRVRNDPAEIERREAMLTLMRQGWGQANPAFRQMFTSLFIPGGSDAEMRWLNDLQRVSTSPDHAIRRSIATSTIDVSSLLPKVAVPTLVMHCRDDAVVPFHAGMELAKSIPGARFRALEGKNHLLLENEPAWPQFAAEVRRFLST